MRLAVASALLSCEAAFWIASSPYWPFSASLIFVMAVLYSSASGSFSEPIETFSDACMMDAFNCSLLRSFTLISVLTPAFFWTLSSLPATPVLTEVTEGVELPLAAMGIDTIDLLERAIYATMRETP